MSDAPIPVPSTPLNDALIQILHGATSVGGEAKDFILAQAPDVIRQFITFNLIKEWSLVGVGILLLLVALTIIIVWCVKGWWNFDKHFEKLMPGTMISIIFFMIGCVTLGDHASNALKITFAPKIYLIEAANNLIHGKSL